MVAGCEGDRRLRSAAEVTEEDGADWDYHIDDVNVALGNLVADVAGAESNWTALRS